MSAIRDEFTVHMLNEQGKQKAARIAATFSLALDQLEEICGKQGREMAIVRTHLQDASFYAKRAMALRPENQQGQEDGSPIGFGSQTPPVAGDASEPKSEGGFVMTRSMVARQRIDEWLTWAGLQLTDLIRATVGGSGGGPGQSNSSGPASAEASQPTPPLTWGGK